MTPDSELAGWLRLTLTPGIGAASLRALLQRHGLPSQVLRQRASELTRIISQEALAALESPPVREAADKALQWAALPGHFVTTLADTGYPRLLLETADPPALLYAVGRAELLQGPALAVVGSRNATTQGERNAESFAREFSQVGLTIVSGLAAGVDAAAHRGGLAGKASTIAVLGTGIDVVYPPRNRDLADRIAAEGLLLSEFPLGTPALAHHFPRRNRLISGLSRGCLVVEAALGSGSLITARFAAEQGREVFAIPGSIHSPLSRGCHALIKSGAKLVDSADDVLVELGVTTPAGPTPAASNPAPNGQLDPLLAHMGFDPIDVETLCARTGLTVDRVSSDLVQLELAGRVGALPGGRYQRLA